VRKLVKSADLHARSSRIRVDQSALGIFQQAQLHLRSHFCEVIEFMERTAVLSRGGKKGGQTASLDPRPTSCASSTWMACSSGRRCANIYSIPLPDLNAEPAISLEDLLTGGKLKVESTKGEMAKDSNESKERQLSPQTKLQEVRNKGAEQKAKSAAAKVKSAKPAPKASSGGR
jgi:hypothetical protein